MPVYQAPVADTLFVLNDILGWERHGNLPGFADATPDVVEAILGSALVVLQIGIRSCLVWRFCI